MSLVTLTLPEESWEILEESLYLDSVSSSVDRPLREKIAAALDTIKRVNVQPDPDPNDRPFFGRLSFEFTVMADTQQFALDVLSDLGETLARVTDYASWRNGAYELRGFVVSAEEECS